MVLLVIAFLRGRDRDLSVLDQQNFILNYAKEHSICVNATEIDNTMSKTSLEDRLPFMELLKSLKSGDTILVYSAYSLSRKVGELVKIFDCIFKHEINVHICSDGVVINKDTTSHFIMDFLSKIREQNKISQSLTTGRPKGSFSKSKFDKHRQEIIDMLKEGLSVSQIAKNLKYSRSSIKDYINSRSLKEIANLKDLTINSQKHLYNNEHFESSECPLTKS